MAAEQEFDYSFTAWPNSNVLREPAIFQLFAANNRRIERICTPTTFATFRAELAKYGFELHEITRVPHHDPEPVL